MVDLDALTYISADDYDSWIKVGMALKHEGHPLSDWEAWSTKSAKYRNGECEKKWNSFNEQNAGKIVTGGTIIDLAKQNGYEVTKDEGFGWDDIVEEVGRDYHIIDSGFVRPEVVPGVPDNYDGAAELREYLSELFDSDQYVGYCDKLTWNEERNVYEPKNSIKTRTAGELIEALKKGFNGASITPESDGGALIRFNPLDGAGEADRNVAGFNYCLVESDKDSMEKQYALYKELKLPIKFLVVSGNKSLHALVHVDAQNSAQYREHVNFIYDFCRKNGLQIDENDKNASRYSRMPGVKRKGKYQYIAERNLGFTTYKEWKAWADTQNDNLPEDVTLDKILDNLPPLKPELISGVLREGHKLLLSGPSKAGKSFLLMNLAISISEGIPWIGHECRQGKVMYINLELDEASCYHRFADIYHKLDITPKHSSDLSVWNLRGRAVPMDKLTPFLINRIKDKDYSAIILDPIYKVITGDENNATDMSLFCSYFDKVASDTGASLIYCHHHSKGAANKYGNAMDRASGSGVFARDPDAILDLTQLDLKGVNLDSYHKAVPDSSDDLTGWVMDGTLREFPPMDEVRIWFDWPIHRVDEWNLLANAKTESNEKNQNGVADGQISRGDAATIMKEQFDFMTFSENEAVNLDSFIEAIGMTEGQIKRNAGTKSRFECGTLVDGTKIIFLRGSKEVTYQGKTYARPKGKHGNKWKLAP